MWTSNGCILSLATFAFVSSSLVATNGFTISPLHGIYHPQHRYSIVAQSLHATSLLASPSLTTPSDVIVPSKEATRFKLDLLTSLQRLRELKARDGDFAIDFGVRGGELNETSRAPQKVDYYAISLDVGRAADDVMSICNSLATVNPCEEPTKYLGNQVNGTSVRIMPKQNVSSFCFLASMDFLPFTCVHSFM